MMVMADLPQTTMSGRLSVQTTCCRKEWGLVWQVRCDALRWRELASQEVTDAREDGIMAVIVPPPTENVFIQLTKSELAKCLDPK